MMLLHTVSFSIITQRTCFGLFWAGPEQMLRYGITTSLGITLVQFLDCRSQAILMTN